jgi:hypothetical protein
MPGGWPIHSLRTPCRRDRDADAALSGRGGVRIRRAPVACPSRGWHVGDAPVARGRGVCGAPASPLARSQEGGPRPKPRPGLNTLYIRRYSGLAQRCRREREPMIYTKGATTRARSEKAIG